MEIRRLAAPKLDAAHLGRRLLCHRPCRHGPPRMCIERNGTQIIVHNYGHAGSGWTLAPGVVRHCTELMMRELAAMSDDDMNSTPICVFGAGVIGLFTAYDLLKHGFTNVTVLAECFEELASHNAGGLLTPTCLELDDCDVEMVALMDQICFDAYRYYAEIARGENPDFAATAARFVPAYFDVGKCASLDAYVEAGIMQPAKEVFVQLGTKSSSEKLQRMCVFDDAIFIETTRMLHTLGQLLNANGVKFVQRRIHSLAELADSARIVMNCTGYGARALCKDERMHSIQGHLILLQDQEPTEMNYMLVHWADSGETESGQRVQRAFYIFPKCSQPDTGNERDVGVIGGTFVRDADASTPNAGEFDMIVQRAKQFFGLQ